MKNCRLKDTIEDLIILSQHEVLSDDEKRILSEHIAVCEICAQMEKEYIILERSLEKSIVPAVKFPDTGIIFNNCNESKGYFMNWKKVAIAIITIGTIIFLTMSGNREGKKIASKQEKKNEVTTGEKTLEIKKGSVVFDVEKGTAYLQKYMEIKNQVNKRSLLELKDSVTTMSNSEVTVYYSDFVKIKMKSNTQLQYFKNYVHMKNGKMNVNMFRKGNKFTIKTPIAMAGILGTEFSIAVSNNRMKVIVREGTVKVWNEKGVEHIKAGHICTVGKGEAPYLKKTGSSSAIKAVGTRNNDGGSVSNTGLDTLINR
ncbi:FecR domain-containing protein [bacterium]|nr:FecR domain-containing protein [bacterium]